MTLTVFVPTIANMASPAPASVVSAIPPVMASTVSRQVSSLFRETSCQTRWLAPITYRMMKRPIPRVTSHCVTLQGLRSFSEGKGCPLCGILVSLPGISRPAAGERRGTPRELPRADVAARSEVSGSPLDLC